MDIAETAASVGPSTPPDWSALDTDLHCPRCEYNLRMLTQPRCPECGLEFDWQELIAASARERECPIFEYQWRKRPVRSFLYTVWLSLQPWRLWRTVKLEFEPRVGPLLVLAAITLSGTYVLMAVMAALSQLAAQYKFGGAAGFWIVFQQYFRREPLAFAIQTRVAPLMVVLAAIGIYRLTMLRFRIRGVHLVRIGVLAWLAWLALALATSFVIWCAAVTLLLTQPGRNRFLLAWADEVARALTVALYFASIALAFRHYLRLPRAWLAAGASMALATVAITVLTVAYHVYTPRRTFGAGLAPLDEWIPGLQWFCLRVLSSG